MSCNCEPKKYSLSFGCCEPVLGPIEAYYTKFQIDKMLEEIESGITSGCCITPEEVDEKIDEAISGITPCDLSEYWTSAETQSAITESVNGKQDTLVAGTNITISGNVISAANGSLNLPIYSGSNSSSVSVNVPSGSENGYNNISGQVSFGAGYMVETKNREEAAFGVYNVSSGGSEQFTYSSGNTLFSVGNGNPQNEGGYVNKHNAFQIMQNGDIYYADTNDTTESEAYAKPMVKLQDIIASLQSQINELRAQIQ